MISAPFGSKALVSFIAAGIAAGVLTGCATEPPASVAYVAPPPPTVALSAHTLATAAEFRAYLRRAALITPVFRAGPEVEQSLVQGAQYEPQEFSKGVIAYAALIALQDPQFVSGVRAYAIDPEGRRGIAAKILADPAYAAALPNAPSAAGLIVATLNAEGVKMSGAGEAVKQAAYSVQHQKWSKLPVPHPEIRLAQAKSLSTAPMTSMPADVDELRAAVGGGSDAAAVGPRLQTVAGGPLQGPYTPVVARGLAVAALAVLGEGGDDHDADVQGLLNETSGGFCLSMSKLNLYQCLAVAKPYYEDVFCLGQHVLIDTGQCVAGAAGKPAPAGPTPVSLASTSLAPVGAAAGVGSVISTH